MDILNKPIGWIIEQCYKLIPNYAIALLILAVVMKVLLFPFGIKQQKNMVRQAKLRPKEMAIRKRYAGREDKVTQQKMQQEVMKLYQDEGYNPASGCLPMILQLVIIFALYAVIQNPLTYVSSLEKDDINDLGKAVVQLYDEGKLDKSQFSSNAIKQIEAQVKKIDRTENAENPLKDVKNPFSAQGMQVELVRIVRDNYDTFVYNELVPRNVDLSKLPDFTIFGGKFDLSVNPTLGLNWTVLIPILTFIFTFGSMKITKKLTYQAPTQQSADMGCSMKIMDYAMPLMSTFITLSVPAIIAVYWIYQNVLSTLQQLILKLMYPIPTFTEEEYKAVEREMNKGIKQPKKSERKNKRAAHRIDLDDEAEQEEKTEKKPSEKKAKASSLLAPAEMKDESDKKTDNE